MKGKNAWMKGISSNPYNWSVFMEIEKMGTSGRPVGNRSGGVPVLPPLLEASVGGGWLVKRRFNRRGR